MKKIFILLIAVCITSLGGYFYYKKNLEIHPIVTACSEVIKNFIDSPSSYKLKSALMQVLENDFPVVIINYESANQFGTLVESDAIFIFGENIIESKTNYNTSKALQNQHNGDSPFEVFRLSDVNISGRTINVLLASGTYTLAYMKANKSYIGRSAPGKIIFHDNTYTIQPGNLFYEK